MQDARRHAPATARNRDPILEVLRRVLPARGSVLEIAAGTGEHAVHFASALPGLTWQPSDADADCLASIDAWRRAQGTPNLRPPLLLDAAAPVWPLDGLVEAIFNANMIHISPWSACLGLLDGAARHLSEDGVLVLYGPWRIGGRHTAPSNAAFDADMRSRNPAWGVRDLDDLTKEASARGLALVERIEMPANNQVLVLRRRGG
jgi:hypothetical protein